MIEWLQHTSVQYASLFIWLTLFSLLSIVLVVTVGARVLARLPPDYFINESRPDNREYLQHFHPMLRGVIPLTKNVVGLLLILAGFVMVFVPGQGLLTILAGVIMMDFPGKWRCARWLLRNRQVRRSVNWLRRRAGTTDLILD
jgi:hypothetical protein